KVIVKGAEDEGDIPGIGEALDEPEDKAAPGQQFETWQEQGQHGVVENRLWEDKIEQYAQCVAYDEEHSEARSQRDDGDHCNAVSGAIHGHAPSVEGRCLTSAQTLAGWLQIFPGKMRSRSNRGGRRKGSTWLWWDRPSYRKRDRYPLAVERSGCPSPASPE